MTDGHVWMVEVVGRRARHPQPLHHAMRTSVCSSGKRDNFIEFQTLKAVVESGTSRLSRVAVPPGIVGQPPPNLDARREVGRERGQAKSRQPDELCATR